MKDPYNSVKTAIKNGYRLIDTAVNYKNEGEIGRAITDCIEEKIIKREEIFVITKIPPKETADAEASLKRSLERLKLDYVDLYLIHSPMHLEEDGKVRFMPMHKLWGAMETCVEKKLCRLIGVSNFSNQLVLDLLSYAKIKPVFNEVEMHPYFTNQDLYDFSVDFKIIPIAYNSLGQGSYSKGHIEYEKYNLLEDEVIKKLALKYKKSPGQILLNWALNKGCVVIPKSENETRQKENLESADFVLEDQDYLLIEDMNKNLRYLKSKDKPWSGGIEIFS